MANTMIPAVTAPALRRSIVPRASTAITAQRYLSHLHEVGRVEIRLRYGSGGRPEHAYRWNRASQS
jgi:response regulator of citrate/malate metabolism